VHSHKERKRARVFIPSASAQIYLLWAISGIRKHAQVGSLSSKNAEEETTDGNNDGSAKSFYLCLWGGDTFPQRHQSAVLLECRERK
jgi:hypothetical protein